VRLARTTWRARARDAQDINYELRCLFTFFRWAVKQNYLFANPVTNIEKFRVPKQSLPRFMTSEELRKFSPPAARTNAVSSQRFC
jgi:site-specific recombinase XerC